MTKRKIHRTDATPHEGVHNDRDKGRGSIRREFTGRVLANLVAKALWEAIKSFFD